MTTTKEKCARAHLKPAFARYISYAPCCYLAFTMACLLVFLRILLLTSRPRPTFRVSPRRVAADNQHAKAASVGGPIWPNVSGESTPPSLTNITSKVPAETAGNGKSPHRAGTAAITPEQGELAASTANRSKSKCFCILLIIIFNTGGHYGNVDFLKSVYGRAFQHIAIYGDGNNRPEDVRPALGGGNGIFQQQTIIKAMKDNPTYDGYLWIGDDVWFNYAHVLFTMDPSKIWLTPENGKGRITKYNPGWRWQDNMGIPALRKHYHKIPRKFLQRMESAFGSADAVIHAFSDVGYIPRQFVSDFIYFASILPDVNFEIVIPTTLHLVSRREDREYFLNPGLLWYDGKREHVWDFWSPNMSFLHPVKMSNHKLREYVVKWTNESIQLRNLKLLDHYKC